MRLGFYARLFAGSLFAMGLWSPAFALPNVLEIDSIDSTASGVTALISTSFTNPPPSAIQLASYHCIGDLPARRMAERACWFTLPAQKVAIPRTPTAAEVSTMLPGTAGTARI